MTLRANCARVRLRVVITSRVRSYGQSHGLAVDDHGVGRGGVHSSSDRHGVTIWPFAYKPILNFLDETNARSGARPAVADGERTHVSTREMSHSTGWIGSRADEDSTQGGVR